MRAKLRTLLGSLGMELIPGLGCVCLLKRFWIPGRARYHLLTVRTISEVRTCKQSGRRDAIYSTEESTPFPRFRNLDYSRQVTRHGDHLDFALRRRYGVDSVSQLLPVLLSMGPPDHWHTGLDVH